MSICLAFFHQQCSNGSVSITVLIISVLITFLTTLGVGAVLSSVITYYVMKTKVVQRQHTAEREEGPVYEDTSLSVTRDNNNIKMGENVAYSSVIR